MPCADELTLHNNVETYRKDVTNCLTTKNCLMPIKEKIFRNKVDSREGILRLVIRELRETITNFGSRAPDDMKFESFAKLAIVLIFDQLYKYENLDEVKKLIKNLYGETVTVAPNSRIDKIQVVKKNEVLYVTSIYLKENRDWFDLSDVPAQNNDDNESDFSYKVIVSGQWYYFNLHNLL